MKKIGKILLLIVMMISLAACGEKNTPTQEQIKFGSTVNLRGFNLDLVNYSVRNAATDKEKYTKLIYLEVNATNVSGRAAVFSDSVYTSYGPDNIKLPLISSTNYPTMLSKMGSIRNGGSTNGHLIIPFVGYGEYYIEFTTTSGIRTFKFIVQE